MPLDIVARNTVRDEALEEHCTGLILAVSGGADSMAMLRWYASRNLAFPLTVAHVHHGLRPESDGEEELVRTYCQSLNLPLCVLHTRVREEMQKGETVESAARRLRYAFFAKIAKERGASHLATAHTLDDQGETVLLHLIHGAGPKGLCGIFPKHTEGDLTVIRPLLQCSRQEIEAYCKENKIPFATDASNKDLHYTRNRIRHEILPKLRELNPNINATLGRTAAILQQQQSAAEARADAFLAKTSRAIPAQDLRILPPAEQAEILRRFCSKGGKELSAEQTGQALNLLKKAEGTVEFDRRWVLHLGQNNLTLTEKKEKIPMTPLQITQEETPLPDGRILRMIPTLATAENRHTLLAASLPLTLRTRNRGDKIQTPAGTKPLSKRMMELRIPLEERDNLILLTDNNRLLWCETVGLAHKTTPQAGEKGYFITLSEE